MNERGAERAVLTQLGSQFKNRRDGRFSGRRRRRNQIIKYIETAESARWVGAASSAHGETPFISARTVLQVGEGLVAVQRVLLPAVSLHRYLLHPDDLRDAQEEKWRPDRPQRPPEAGQMAFHPPLPL